MELPFTEMRNKHQRKSTAAQLSGVSLFLTVGIPGDPVTAGTSALILSIWFSLFCLFCHGVRLVVMKECSVLSQRLM